MKKMTLIGAVIIISISASWLFNFKKTTQAESSHRSTSIETNPEQSIGTYSYLLTQQANSGDTSAQNALAMMYLLGINIRPNQLRANYWFEKAAINGNETARVILANAYLSGKSTLGIKKNSEKGIYWTKKVALCNSEGKRARILASNILGDMYSNGDEIPKNFAEASRWYKLAVTLQKD